MAVLCAFSFLAIASEQEPAVNIWETTELPRQEEDAEKFKTCADKIGTQDAAEPIIEDCSFFANGDNCLNEKHNKYASCCKISCAWDFVCRKPYENARSIPEDSPYTEFTWMANMVEDLSLHESFWSFFGFYKSWSTVGDNSCEKAKDGGYSDRSVFKLLCPNLAEPESDKVKLVEAFGCPADGTEEGPIKPKKDKDNGKGTEGKDSAATTLGFTVLAALLVMIA